MADDNRRTAGIQGPSRNEGGCIQGVADVNRGAAGVGGLCHDVGDVTRRMSDVEGPSPYRRRKTLPGTPEWWEQDEVHNNYVYGLFGDSLGGIRSGAIPKSDGKSENLPS